ncbi:hypothetical protein Fmac_016496 [Flemingia macrophylla]|uniref:Uncharacterized protein n=1 Tax=Flemingia macrophylla TaxID=520843 RepID=A0ABD1MID7_9FABA
MNINQVAAKKPRIYAISVSQTQLCPSIHFKPCILLMDYDPLSVISKKNLGTKPSCVLQCQPILKSRQSPHVCVAGGRGSMNNNEDSQMKSLEKGVEQLNGQSIEDILRQQMQKGGTGCKPPGGRGDGNSPSGSEDGGSGGMNETLQYVEKHLSKKYQITICMPGGISPAEEYIEPNNYAP